MKKFISLFVAFAIAFNFICVQVAAEDEAQNTSGIIQCPEADMTWEFKNGELHIFDSQSSPLQPHTMPDFEAEGFNAAPWSHLRQDIETVKVDNYLSIGDYAFYGCEKLRGINFLPIRERIGKHAFDGCISFEGDSTGSAPAGALTGYLSVKKIEEGAFKNCQAIKTLSPGSSVTSIGAGAFENSGIQTVEFKEANSLWNLGEGAFQNCSDLNKVNFDIPQSDGKTKQAIKDIVAYTFAGCSSLKNTSFLKETVSIGSYAFMGSGVENAVIPDTVTSMGEGVFAECKSLVGVKLPDGLEAISKGMFSQDTSLTRFDFGKNIKEIGEGAFAGTGLTELKIPYRNTDNSDADNIIIGESAFSGCVALTDVVLPPNVSVIGDYAFNSCGSLKNLFISQNTKAPDGDTITNLVLRTTYKIIYQDNFADPNDPTAKITSIESGEDAGELVNLPTYLVLHDGSENGINLRLTEVDPGYRDKISQNHSHIPDSSGKCTLCNLDCGESKGTTWAVTDNGTLIISAVETANDNIKGKMENYPSGNDVRPWSGKTISALEIKEGVISIGDNAFKGLSIDKIIIPSSVKNIGQGAFSEISTLKPDTLPDGTDTGTRTVFLPPMVENIGSEVFKGTDVDLILYPNEIMLGALPANTVRAFYKEDGDTVSIIKVDKDGFTGTYRYPKTVIINGVEKRVVAKDCDHKFDSEYGQCTICEAVIGGNIGKTGDDASAPADDKVTWYWSPDDGTVYICTKKDSNNTAITDAPIKNYDKGENKNPFIKLKNDENAVITDLVFDGGVTSIGDYAFYDLNSLKEINIPSVVTDIGNGAFEDCRAVTKLVISNGVKTIGAMAFYNINFNGGGNRTFVEIPESVDNIGEDAFAGCTELNYAAYPDKFSATIVNAEIPNQVFKLEYKTSASDLDKVEVTKIIPGRLNTLISMPKQICGKDVAKVDENYHELVNKDDCDHFYIDTVTNTCPVCGKVKGDAGENKDGKVEWEFRDGILTVWSSDGTPARMKNFSNTDNPPWHSNMHMINKVVIKEGIVNIGEYAFVNAKSLETVEYPLDSLEEIGYHAFEGCGEYGKVTIPDSVKVLGEDVFYNTNSISVPDGLNTIQYPHITLKQSLYEQYEYSFITSDENDPKKTQAVLMLYSDTDEGRQITGAVLTNGYSRDRLESGELTYPVAKGHEHCFNKENICILCGTVGGNCGPDKNPTETKWALNRDTGEISITGNGVVAVNPWQDNYQGTITSVFVGNGVTSICEDAFKDCVNLSSLEFEAGSQLNSIGDNAFSGSGLYGRVIIPSNVSAVGENAFNGCNGLTNLMISESFAENNPPINLSGQNAAVLVYSNDGSAVLGIRVPAGKTGVEVDIPSEVLDGVSVNTVKGDYNTNTETVSRVIIPDTVNTIGESAFKGFGSAGGGLEINIPDSVTSIGSEAFSGSAVQNITLPSGVTVINYRVFYDCQQLESVTVSPSLTEIGNEAFASCNKLLSLKTADITDKTGIYLGNTSIRIVGDTAFAGCSAIKEASFMDTVGYLSTLETIGKFVFNGCEALTKVVLPDSLKNTVSGNIFDGCDKLAIVEIPENVSSEIMAVYDVLGNSTTTVIVYKYLTVNEKSAYYIVSAVYGNEQNWEGRRQQDEDGKVRIDDWLLVWDGHRHCFNDDRQCVLCEQQGGMCGEKAVWVYDKLTHTIIINANGGDGVMWDLISGDNHYQEMWGELSSEIETVIVKEGMKTIGANAFADRSELSAVYLPASLEKIGAKAFSSTGLSTVEIADGSSLMTIEEGAFKNCGQLTSIGEKSTALFPASLRNIGNESFSGCTGLREIVISCGNAVIGANAFAGCTNLASVKLPQLLTSVGSGAFTNCVSLTAIELSMCSDSVNSFGKSIFAGCTKLTYAVVPSDFNEKDNFDNEAFVTLIKYAVPPEGEKGIRVITKVKYVGEDFALTVPDYIIGAPVRKIAGGAFNSFTANKPFGVILPSTLTAINDSAFKGCTMLSEITVPGGALASIGKQAFQGCTSLKKIEIPDSVTQLGMEAFNMCTALEEVKLSNGLNTIEKLTFYGCSSLKAAVVPENVKKIDALAFEDCSVLEYVVLPKSLRNGSVDLTAFDGCGDLAAIFAPTEDDIDYKDGEDGKYFESIISDADAEAYNLRIAVYDQDKQIFKVKDGTSDNGMSTYETVLGCPTGFRIRENPAHFHCFNIHNQCILCGDRGGQCGPMAEWTLDEGGNLKITVIEEGAESVIDHDAAEYFGTWTEFKDRIYTIEIDEGITLIDSGAFEHCLRLQSVTLPESLETVEDYAFSDCISLISIDLPDGIINLGEGVFKDDINLKNVELPKSISELKKDTFKGCRTLETIKLPADLRYVSEGAFSGCINLTSIELPVDTKKVSEDAFSDCTNLTYIVAPEGCRYTFNENEFPNATYFKYAPEGVGVRITYARPGANVHHLIIPTEIAGLPVVAIGDGAFTRTSARNFAALSEEGQEQQGLVTVTIPENSLLTEIGNDAFKDRTDLQKLIVKNNKIVSIGKSAFEGCTSLEEAGLPSSVQRIGEKAFFGCGKLKNIPIYEGLLSIGTEAFANCGFNRAFVIIPSTVSEMGTSVFGNIADNALIAIPQKLAKRYDDSHAGNTGSYDFRKDNCGYVVYRVDVNGNKWVTEGKLGNGQNAITGFEDYMKIASDHEHCLYKGFCVLCNFAGGNCGSEEDINGNSNATWYIDRETKTLHITGKGKMKDYTGSDVAPWLKWNDFIANIEVHDGITGISANAFMNCEKVTSVKLPSTLVKIGSNAFVGNTALTSLTVPEGVTIIRENTFKDCGQLKEINLPKSVEKIEAGAFAGCASLKYVELPAAGHDIFIDKSAFDDSLDYIALPVGTVITAETTSYNRFTYLLDNESAARIVNAKLGNNRELKFPASIGGIPVKAIGGYGYNNVINGNDPKNIRFVSIPEGVTEIYDEAFAGCENLFSLSLPNSLETIRNNAFSGCGIKELIFKNSLKSIGEYAFSGCGALETVKLPLGIESIGNYVFSECENLDFILTPRKVIDNRGYTKTANLVYYERRADGRDYIAAAKLGEGRTNINVEEIEALGVYLDIDNHEHCYNEGVCVLCNDDGGLCGVGVVWKLNGDTLEIKLREGLTAREADTGEMYDYSPSNPAPWFNEHRDSVKKLVIRDGVISLGTYAFSGLTSLSDISEAFPESLVKIGEKAFENCTSLAGNSDNGRTLILDENVKTVAPGAFAGCTSIKKIILSDSTAEALNVPEDTAVIKYSFIDGARARITKIEISGEKSVDVPNEILKHQVVEVAKEYRKYVNTDTHTHYHNEGDSRCTICDIISGECGDKVTWYIDEKNKRLVIEGNGEMYDYNVDGGKNAPWTQYAELTDSIYINEGVTYIGDNAFVNMGSFDEITLPPGIKSVGDNVFAGCEIRRMYIPSGLKAELFGKDIEKVTYKRSEDKTWVEVTRIDLPDGKTKISLPKTIYNLPVKSVEKEFRKYVDQNDGHVHDYGEEHGESECVICGKVTYNHIWEDGWNSDENSHWHDCERGDYDPIRDGNIDGSEYGDHDWVNTGEKRDGKIVYRCSECEREKLVDSSVDPGPDNPNPPVTDNTGGGFVPPPATTSNDGGTTKPPAPGDGSGGNGGSGSGNNGGGTTTYPPQPWETEGTEKPPVTNPPSDNIPDVDDFNGKYGFEVEKGSNSLNATVADSDSSLIKAVLTEEERDKMINGTSDIRIILSVTEGDGTVSLRDRAIISAALGEYKLGEYLDISLFKVVDGVRERITHTSAPITITIDIPNGLRNSGRRFRVIRAHEGKAAVLRDLDNGANTVTISTDRFSPYAIAYTDSISVSDDYDPPMPTGDPGISAFIFVTMASGLTAVGMIYFNHVSDVEFEEERRKKIARLVAFGKKGKLQKYIAIPLIFLVTLYYQGIEGIQGSRKAKAKN